LALAAHSAEVAGEEEEEEETSMETFVSEIEDPL